VRNYWQDVAARLGSLAATRAVFAAIAEFVRDSTPEKRRQRFGDAEYDWDYRVNTTSGAVGWRDRLIGTFYSAYQPTEPILFHDMMAGWAEVTRSDFREFTFLDLGSGKGRTLLMASEYPFRRIVGVELLPSLHAIAQQNLAAYKSESQRCFAMESVCGDATNFPLPDGPLLVYLFNPFSGNILTRAVRNLEKSFQANSRPIHVLYHNPEHENVLLERPVFKKVAATHQYAIFVAAM
jgi:SAM-dependent methyltransferase